VKSEECRVNNLGALFGVEYPAPHFLIKAYNLWETLCILCETLCNR